MGQVRVSLADLVTRFNHDLFERKWSRHQQEFAATVHLIFAPKGSDQETFMKLIARICADYRHIGWMFTIAMSIAPALGFLGYRISEPVTDGWFDADTVAAMDRLETTFEITDQVVLVLRCDDFFQPDRMSALHEAVASLRDRSAVNKVIWMGDVPEVTILGRSRSVLPAPETEPTAEELAEAREVLRQHPLVQNSLLSSDAQTVLILVKLIDPEEEGSITTSQVQQEVQNRLSSYDISVGITGARPLHELHDRILDRDHVRIQITAYLLVTALAILIFRKPVAIIVASTGPVLGVVWTYGWLYLIGHGDNELAKIILPVLIMMIGFADGMHLVVRMRHLRSEGVNIRDSVYESIIHIGPACLLTSITTSIGFGSLMISNSEMIAGFGFVSAIGVVVTFFSVIVVTPLMANSWLGARMHVDAEQDLVGNLMIKCLPVIEFASRHAKVVTVGGAIVTALCLVTSLQLEPGDRISDRVPQQSDEFKAMRYCDSKLGGIRTVRVLLEFDDGVSRKEVWQMVTRLEDLLAKEPLIQSPRSIRTMLTVFKGDRQDQAVLANKLPDALRNQYYRPDLNMAQVSGRVQDASYVEFEPMFERLDAALIKMEGEFPSFRLKVLSGVRVEGEVVRQVIVELIRSLALASIIIFFTLAIAFRSARIGLVTILPNIMPLAAAGALRLMISESLGIASALSFAICLGIAVDDTIHYLNHFLHERKNGATPLEANRRTFRSVGSALVMTTVVMIAGLGSVMTSSMPPHVSFAAMGVTTLLVALVADLVVLPAVLTLFPGPAGEAVDAGDQKTEADDVITGNVLTEDVISGDLNSGSVNSGDLNSGSAANWEHPVPDAEPAADLAPNTANGRSIEISQPQLKIAEVEPEGT
ncbi:MAG: MMPL family transporter [Fuerstiella sp.]